MQNVPLDTPAPSQMPAMVNPSGPLSRRMAQAAICNCARVRSPFGRPSL